MQPGRVKELFFLDEASAFAAGHRPCALCRRTDYGHLQTIWRERHGRRPGVDAIDRQLHAERLGGDGAQRHHDGSFDGLPDGAFVLHGGAP